MRFPRLHLVCAGLVLVGSAATAAAAPSSGRAPATVEEARQQVALLADFYREALDQAHTLWVRDGKAPAATVIKQLFPEMKRRGWPEAQWLSVNGQPLNPSNSPRDAFETAAARALRKGERWVEETKGGTYRAVLSVPFTGSCYKCHFTDKPLHSQGALSFRIELRGKLSTSSPKKR